MDILVEFEEKKLYNHLKNEIKCIRKWIERSESWMTLKMDAFSLKVAKEFN